MPMPDNRLPETAHAELYDQLQYQVAIFARRVEQARIGALGDQRNSMDRAAFLLLNRLERTGAVGVKALAQAMGIDSSTVTRQVAPLVDCGLVDRVQNPDDGRAVLLELSEQGRQRLEQVRCSRQELMRALLDGWPEEEQEAFVALLTRFNHAIEAHRP
jgi:DNA-binding MarR family transcriptional regulator